MSITMAQLLATSAAERLSRLCLYFLWPHMYKWVRNWLCTFEICQRVKPSPSSQAPLQPLPISAEAWRSVSTDFIFGLAPNNQDRTGILVFVDRFSKMTHMVPVYATITTIQTAMHFIDAVFRHHRLPENIVSDRDSHSHPHFGRHRSSHLERSCRCQQRPIRRRMGKRNV